MPHGRASIRPASRATIIFVFIGSFILAEAMFVHGVDRRIAYTALSWKFVGSSAPRANIELLLEITGIRPYLPAVVSMEDTRRGKPDPEPFDA